MAKKKTVEVDGYDRRKPDSKKRSKKTVDVKPHKRAKPK